MAHFEYRKALPLPEESRSRRAAVATLDDLWVGSDGRRTSGCMGYKGYGSLTLHPSSTPAAWHQILRWRLNSQAFRLLMGSSAAIAADDHRAPPRGSELAGAATLDLAQSASNRR